MPNDMTEDTKAILLLCATLPGECAHNPLSVKQYSTLARWLHENGERPAAMLRKDMAKSVPASLGLAADRLDFLLARGGKLASALAQWESAGIRVISRSDGEYPARFRRLLLDEAPPLLFYAGNKSLLQGGGLAIVGSRDADKAGLACAREAARLCAEKGAAVISGGADGVDQEAAEAALAAGGKVIAILACELLRKSLEPRMRADLGGGRLLAMSPHAPHVPFQAWRAMDRNKLIYVLADYALVVSAQYGRGGTWQGASEQLGRKSQPVFVRDVPAGNRELLERGGIAWPEAWDGRLERLEELARDAAPKAAGPEMAAPKNEPSIYDLVLPLIMAKLDREMTAEELAQSLDLNKAQLNQWLKRAVEDQIVVKYAKPTRYRLKKSAMAQLALPDAAKEGKAGERA